MSSEIGQKPPPSILVGRFKALLKQRNDSAPTTEEIVQIYDLLLSELTCNVKPIITDLTIIAEQLRDHAKGIVDAICARILEVPADQKLPSLYLLDSIVKNVGQEYVRYFSIRLPEVFCEVYGQVQPNLHSAMRHLFGTWSKVFPSSILHKIEAQLQFSQAVNSQLSSVNPLRTSESPRPTHGIHVNPKYVGVERLDSTGTVGNTNTSKIHQFVPNRLGRSSSPSRIGLDRPLSMYMEYVAGNSSGRTVGRESLHPAVDYGVAKALGREEELSEWQQKQFSGDSPKRLQNYMTHSLVNGQQRQSPRALIDAYGSDRSQETSGSKPLLVERLDRNGVDKVLTTSWQNTEEEEFDWEDMSPTLVDHNRNNGFLQSSIGFSTEKPTIVTANATSKQYTRNGWSSGSQLPPVNDSSFIPEDAFASSAVSGFQNQINQNMGPGQHLDAWKISNHLSNSTPHLFNIRGRGRSLLMPPIDNISNTDVNSYGSRVALPRMVPGLKSNVEGRPPILPATFGMRSSVNVHAAHPPSSNHVFPLKNLVRNQFELVNANNTIMSNCPNKSLIMHEQTLHSVENKDISKGNIHQLPNQLAGLISSKPQNRGQAPQLQFFPSQDLAASQFIGGSSSQSTSVSNALPVIPFSFSGQSIANNSALLEGGALPHLPSARPSAASQRIPHPNPSPFVSSQQPTVAYSNLINSLMAQGVISLTNQAPAQDSVGIDFNPDILKVRHESAVSALYGDLPRQCTTCGLRFKCQDEHSSHMDWHVTKNRMSKNRKQKPSRKWFVSEKMWLSGAEALGTESVPGFLPSETIEEKKEDEGLAVPAEEDQNTCALCGEPFDEFYSDETEEWMYKGAVYLNAANGRTAGMDRSQLGPIIHAKCRSESSMAPSEDFGPDEGGTYEEGRQRKRMRG